MYLWTKICHTLFYLFFVSTEKVNIKTKKVMKLLVRQSFKINATYGIMIYLPVGTFVPLLTS